MYTLIIPENIDIQLKKLTKIKNESLGVMVATTDDDKSIVLFCFYDDKAISESAHVKMTNKMERLIESFYDKDFTVYLFHTHPSHLTNFQGQFSNGDLETMKKQTVNYEVGNLGYVLFSYSKNTIGKICKGKGKMEDLKIEVRQFNNKEKLNKLIKDRIEEDDWFDTVRVMNLC